MVQEQDENGAPVATPAPGLDVANGSQPIYAAKVHAPVTGSAGGRSEVAAFVDFENIRYSSINSFGREPDPLAWRDKALKYGLMAVARAYADFDQHPPRRCELGSTWRDSKPSTTPRNARRTGAAGEDPVASRSQFRHRRHQYRSDAARYRDVPPLHRGQGFHPAGDDAA